MAAKCCYFGCVISILPLLKLLCSQLRRCSISGAQQKATRAISILSSTSVPILGAELFVLPRQLSVFFSFSAFELTTACDCERFIVYRQAVSPGHFYLTLSEARRVVVDVGEGDVDHGGSGEAASLSGHVFGLNHHLVVLSLLAVHVARAQGRADHT